MPYHTIESQQLFLHDKCMITDTNLLTSAILPSELHHSSSKEFLETFSSEYDFIIPVEVLIETWGLISGKTGRIDLALELYNWVASPGNATVVYLGNEFYNASKRISEEVEVDIVDSILIYSSQTLAASCRLANPIPIATYETRDFIKYVRLMHAKRKKIAGRQKIILLNPESLDPNEYEF